MISPLALALLIPLTASLILAFIHDVRLAGRIHLTATLLTLVSCLLLPTHPPAADGLFFLDELNGFLVILTALIAFSTAIFSLSYVRCEVDRGRFTPQRVRKFHAISQLLLFALLLALLADNLGILWVGVETATLGTMVMVALYRTPAAIAASWKYFILASVGIALALFGTMLLYLAGQPLLNPGMEALAWSHLIQVAPRMSPPLLTMAFIFFFVGYGTKAGLVPLHAWLPDAHAEGPTPISAVLSGLLLNVAMYALLRCKMMLDANHAALSSAPFFIGFGLLSLLFAAFMLYRRQHAKRLFAYSSIEHMGIIAFAFGIGGPIANLAGLLHMTWHSLTKSAIFFAIGHATQVHRSEYVADLRGLTVSHPALGWGLVTAILAIAGLPPFGLFTSEFLLITATLPQHPVLALLLGVGLLVALGALIGWAQHFGFGHPTLPYSVQKVSLFPLQAHLFLVLVAGIYLPEPILEWFRRMAQLLG